MKEKIKKMFQYICTWEFVVWLNIAFTAFHLVMCFINLHAAYVGGICWHLGFAAMACFLQDYDNEHREDVFLVLSLGYHLRFCQDELAKYKKVYGDLPKEEAEVKSEAQPDEKVESSERKNKAPIKRHKRKKEE
ncbi:MAG: hypothetical protein IJY59_10055 [Bacteroidaceae bacterium]|nr:hypothetical protein [Bacteroidaceae bacterium]